MSEPTRLAGETDTLALLGGRPVRERMLPYGRQHVDESDIRAVVETLRGDWLTNGPAVARFEEAFAAMPEVLPAPTRPGTRHAWHIYPLRLDTDRLREDREAVFRALRAENVGASVHYLPVHLHPFYRERFGTGRGLCPAAEEAADRLLTLPLFPQMTDADIADVIAAMAKVIRWARR